MMIKIKKDIAGRYNIIVNGELFGQVADGRKFNMYHTSGLHWSISCMNTEHRLHKQRFKTLKAAKQKIKTLRQ